MNQINITIEGEHLTDPPAQVLAVASIVQSICQAFELDPAEGVMMLLTAAAHMAIAHSPSGPAAVDAALAESLAGATVAARAWFAPESAEDAARPAAAPNVTLQ